MLRILLVPDKRSMETPTKGFGIAFKNVGTFVKIKFFFVKGRFFTEKISLKKKYLATLDGTYSFNSTPTERFLKKNFMCNFIYLLKLVGSVLAY